ncbi:hypothetical protein PU630_02250 [Microbacterium horticulturae]|uniref:Lipoprotein n=1 Tax=Microbacterium horticulturae TaxID=3028316 RepID=A0ABY8C234_9MICO|nr:hypothetical protein [Microbacterium sp. KACC 23027]WEG09412.1 hypothetical protein PU630_02250 [Microbacterium sp. KACC 23027]
MSSRLGLAAVLVCATALIAGCAPQPDPTPTQTAAFASEDEAFAAAEETYRAYVDAGNSIDFSDPATFEEVYKWETSNALASDKKVFTSYHAQGVTMTGDSVITLLSPQSATTDLSEVKLSACLDVSDVELIDGSGNSLVSADRGDVHSVTIRLVTTAGSDTQLAVAGIASRDGDPACA